MRVLCTLHDVIALVHEIDDVRHSETSEKEGFPQSPYRNNTIASREISVLRLAAFEPGCTFGFSKRIEGKRRGRPRGVLQEG